MVQPGELVLNGKYRVERLLDRGAFGEVYLVTHLALNASRAMKVLRRDTPGVGSTQFTEYRDRFQLEAQLGAQLDHPHVVKVYDFEEADGELCLVMQYCAGGSLKDRLEQQGPLPIADAVRLGLDLCDGLTALHEQLGAIHRDLKPSNVLLDADGRARIGDLGLAQSAGSDRGRTLLGSGAGPQPGTPAYMSPEQETTHGYLLPTSDIYALGCVLFEALTGKVYKSVYGADLRDLRPDAPAWLAAVVARALREAPGRQAADEADPLKRYRRAGQMRADLAAGAHAKGFTLRAVLRRALPWAAMFAALGLILAVWHPWRNGQAPAPIPTAAFSRAPVVTGAEITQPAATPDVTPTAGPVPVEKPASVSPATMMPERTSTAPPPQPTPIPASPIPVTAPPPLTKPSTLYVEYLIDASSGMMQPWTQNTEPRLASIQRVLPTLWQSDAVAMHTGLRAYGHHRSSTDPKTCDDVELLRPVRQWAPNDLIASLFTLRAQGLDSSTTALRDAFGDFQYQPDRLNAVIFLTEGGDTCGGDPLSIIEAQKEIGVVLPTFVVALEPEASDRSGLQNIATQSGGQYFEVFNPSELYETLNAIIEALVKAAP